MVDVPGPGQYGLTLLLQPTMQAGKTGLGTESYRGFDMAIPRLVRSRLELTLPANVPEIEVPSAKGPVTVEGGQLSGELGATDRLRVRWHEDASRRGTEPVVEAEELLWLKIAPGSVVLDARFTFRVFQGEATEFTFIADPRLRLLKPSSTAAIEVVPGSPHLRHVKLSQPCSDRVTVAASFLLKESSGVGNLRLPRLRVENVRTRRRWFAVSVDENLHHEAKAAESLAAVAVPDFVTAWGKTDSQPRFAHGLADGPALWSISTRPWQPRAVVDQKLNVSFGDRNTEVGFEADLTTTAGYGFRYRLEAPVALEVDTIAVLEEEVDRVSRWSREPDGTIHVFLTGPVTGPRRLLLRAHLPTPRQGKVDLPILRLDGGQPRLFDVALFRKPGVLVEVDRADGLTEAEMIVVDPAEDAQGRLVRAFTRDGQQPVKVTCTVRPNRPKLEVRQTTLVACQEQAWTATAQFELDPRGGVVDEIRLQVPPEWTGPYRVDPPMTFAQLDSPDATRLLILRPATAIDDPSHFAVSSPLSGDPIRVQDVSLRQAKARKHVVILPTRDKEKRLRWETRRLKKTDLPQGFPASAVAYEVGNDKFQAVLAPEDQREGVSKIHLADVRIAWRADGSCHGVASFDLEPGGPGLVRVVVAQGLSSRSTLRRGRPDGTDPACRPGWPKQPGRPRGAGRPPLSGSPWPAIPTPAGCRCFHRSTARRRTGRRTDLRHAPPRRSACSTNVVDRQRAPLIRFEQRGRGGGSLRS